MQEVRQAIGKPGKIKMPRVVGSVFWGGDFATGLGVFMMGFRKADSKVAVRGQKDECYRSR